MSKLDPALRKLIATGTAKYPVETVPESGTGIIPLEPIADDFDRRLAMIYEIAQLISDAMRGPAISAMELAELIVEMVEDGA